MNPFNPFNGGGFNPFDRRAPLPSGACGQRGFQSATDAKENALNRSTSSFAVVQAGDEYAWISPAKAFAARALPAMAAGIALVEIVEL